MSALDRADRILSAIERAWMLAAALMMLVIMLASTADVAMRYLFNAPIAALYDLISLYLMPGMFFLALSDTLRVNGHVCVDLLHARMSPRARHGALLGGYALVSVIFAFMTWAACGRMAEAWRNDEVLAGAIQWPTWVASLSVTLGFALVWLRVLHRFAGHGLSLLTGVSAIPLPPISGAEGAE